MMRRLAILPAILLASCLTKLPDSYGYQVTDSGVEYVSLHLNTIASYARQDLAGVDRATFRVLPDRPDYAVDSRQVYYRGAVVEGATPATWRLIGDSNYGTDGARIYYFGNLVDGAEAATFKVHPFNGRASDARHFWEGRAMVGTPEDCGPPETVDARHTGNMLYFCYQLYGLS